MTRNRFSLALVTTIATVALAVAATMSAGCKKNVDPAAFDGGATTTASASAAAPEDTAPVAADPSAVAPLASLAAPKPVVAPKPVAKPAAPTTIEACDKAKAICPNAGRASQSQCLAFTAECTKQGGHL